MVGTDPPPGGSACCMACLQRSPWIHCKHEIPDGAASGSPGEGNRGGSRERHCAKSDVVRERLQRGAGPTPSASARLNLIADPIGSVEGLPAEMSERRKRYLKNRDYGKKPSR